MSVTFIMACAIACAHIFSGHLSFLRVIPRSWVLSAAGGVSVAYVFVHILPELQQHQNVIQDHTPQSLAFLEHHVYLVAMLGLMFFYVMERLVKASAESDSGSQRGEGTPGVGVFWFHMSIFFVYNVLIGYLLLQRTSHSFYSLLLFTIAMTLHFMVNDHSLRTAHKHRYDLAGRWFLTAGVLTGWLAGTVIQVEEAVVSIIFAFLAGGILFNVLKEELPKEQQSRVLPFVFGAIFYSVLLLILATAE